MRLFACKLQRQTQAAVCTGCLWLTGNRACPAVITVSSAFSKKAAAQSPVSVDEEEKNHTRLQNDAHVRSVLSHTGMTDFKRHHVPFISCLLCLLYVPSQIFNAQMYRRRLWIVPQLKRRGAVCIPKGESCETDTTLLSALSLPLRTQLLKKPYLNLSEQTEILLLVITYGNHFMSYPFVKYSSDNMTVQIERHFFLH